VSKSRQEDVYERHITCYASGWTRGGDDTMFESTGISWLDK